MLSDQAANDYWKELTFSLDDVLRPRGEEDEAVALYVSNRLLSLASFKYPPSKTGVHVVGVLLGLGKPWDQIAGHLGRDKREVTAILEGTVSRRTDIVHRADRDRANPEGKPQTITFAQASQGMDTIKHVCLAFELRELRSQPMETA